MDEKKKFCILIPIYKKYDEEKDILRLINLNKLNSIVTGKFDVICLTYSEEMYEYAKNKFSMFNVPLIIEERFFNNVAMYSLFFSISDIWDVLNETYEYTYIVQDDVYVFNDQFKYWVDYCDKYDISYCGGPIVSMNKSWGITNNSKMPKVGNGGFSLRRNSTMSKLLSNEVLNHYGINRSDLVNIILNGISESNNNDNESIMEDVWFCVYMYSRYEFNKLSVEKSYHFSLDMNPDIIFGWLFKSYNLPILIGKGINDNEYKTFSSIVRKPEFISDFKKFNLFGCHASIKNIDVWGNVIDEYKELYEKNPKFIEDLIEHYKINKYQIGKITYKVDKEEVKSSNA